MSYLLFTDKKGFEGRMKRLLKLEKKAGNVIAGIEYTENAVIVEVKKA